MLTLLLAALLSAPAHAPGQTVQMKEGWYRVESDPDEDGGAAAGTFIVMSSPRSSETGVEATAAPDLPETDADAGDDDRSPDTQTCRELRGAYLKELLRIGGIEEVDRPLPFLENLQGGGSLSPWVRLNVFGLATGGPWDAQVAGVPVLQPLAWNFELQRIAARLESCDALP